MFSLSVGQTNQNALLQSQSLQGQTVFIQGQPGTNQQGQTIMLQNQSGHQGQFQIISTTANSSGLQIVPQLHQKQGGITIELALLFKKSYSWIQKHAL